MIFISITSRVKRLQKQVLALRRRQGPVQPVLEVQALRQNLNLKLTPNLKVIPLVVEIQEVSKVSPVKRIRV